MAGSLFLVLFLTLLPMQEPQTVKAPPVFRQWKLLFEKDNAVWIARGDGTQPKRIVSNALRPCWSPDHRRVAFVRKNAIWVVGVDGSAPRKIWSSKGRTVGGDLTWGPHVAIERTQGEPHAGESILFSLPGGGKTSIYQLVPGTSHGAEKLDWLESGTAFEFSNYDEPTWDRSGRRLALSVNGDLWGAIFQDSGTAPDAGASGWDVLRLAATAQYDAPTYRADRANVVLSSIAWSPDGRMIAYGVRRRGGTGYAEVRLLKLRDTEYGPPELIAGSDRQLLDEAGMVSFSPDGNWVIATMGEPGFRASDLVAISIDGRRRVDLIEGARRGRW